ncbi:MAG TPA: hypothetical protein VM840_10955, partial [Actinomycetota bacterium]|nr:hypothetical protein [Actinomycetota bacterium]
MSAVSQAHLTVEPRPTAQAEVRHWLRELGWFEGGVLEVLELLLSELVANSVRHAGLAGSD